jgi:beta-lactamase regulating signal transducer with metallopeptidase domain
MQLPDIIFSARLDQALGWTVLHSIWQITLIALIAAFVLWRCENRSAQLRYRIVNGALLVSFLTCCATFVLYMRSDAYQWRQVRMELLNRQDAAQTTGIANVDEEGDAQQAAKEAPVSRHYDAIMQLRSPKHNFRPVAPDFIDYFNEHLPLLILLWIVGLCIGLFRLMSGFSYLHTLRKRLNFPADPFWEETLHRIAQQIALSRPVALLESALVRTPLTIGYLKPVILFPIGMINRLSEQEVEAILAHELAHIVRHDYLFNLLQHLIETLLYYHPAVWWLSAQVRNERESACDDMAISLLDNNRLRYAKALVVLQDMAMLPHSPALALTGTGKGQLLLRIQRIFSPQHFHINIMEKWIATLLVACSIVALAWGQHFSSHQSYNFNANTAEAEKGDPNSGVWQADVFKDSICLNLSGGNRNNHWSFGSCYLQSAFKDFAKTGDVQYSLSRPAGTLVFTGKMEGETGYGRYTFTPDANYIAELNKQGIKPSDDFLMIHLFFADFDIHYVQNMKKAGIEKIDEEKLTELAVFKIDAEEAKKMVDMSKKAGKSSVSADDLVQLKIANVTEKTIEELAKTGLKDLDFDQITQLSMHQVDPEFIREMNGIGFGTLDADQIFAAKIHNITPEYVQEIKNLNLGDLDFDEVMTLKIHDVDADFLNKMQGAGLKNLTFDELSQLKIHNITPEYIREMKLTGAIQNAEDLIMFKIHGITPEYMQEVKTWGLGSDLTVEEIQSLKIHGIDKAYIQKIQSLGFGKNLDEVMSAKIHDIDADFIKDMQALGFKNLTFDELMSARIHNIDGPFIRQFTEMGFKDQSMDDYMSARIHHLTPDFIKQAEKKGYKFPHLEEYANMKLRNGMLRRSE